MTISEEFDRCWPWLEKAVSQDLGGSHFTKEDVWAAISGGEAQLWAAQNSAAITEFQETYAGGKLVRKILMVWVMGGDTSKKALKELLTDTLPKIEDFGKQNGCQYIVGVGRLGGAWGRILDKHGFAPIHTTYGKEL